MPFYATVKAGALHQECSTLEGLQALQYIFNIFTWPPTSLPFPPPIMIC